MALKLPARNEVPGPQATAGQFRDFVQQFDPTAEFRQLWGADFTEHAGTLDEMLTGQLQAGRLVPDAPLPELLMCFCRMWAMAPYLGMDSVEAFLRNPRALWLLDGIRGKAL